MGFVFLPFLDSVLGYLEATDKTTFSASLFTMGSPQQVAPHIWLRRLLHWVPFLIKGIQRICVSFQDLTEDLLLVRRNVWSITLRPQRISLPKPYYYIFWHLLQDKQTIYTNIKLLKNVHFEFLSFSKWISFFVFIGLCKIWTKLLL